MVLLEYEAKNILSRSNIPTPRGEVFDRAQIAKIKAPVVLKSQVPTGGRGKLGGVKVVKLQSEVEETAQNIFNQEIKGFSPNKILAEEILDIDREFYFSLTINRELSQIELLANTNGGVDIEDQDLNDFFKQQINTANIDTLSDQLADYLDISEQAFLLRDLVFNSYRCFIDNDCLLLEINPLVLTKQDALVAGDAKITLDDSALFRHTEWKFENQEIDHNFVSLNPNGTVATIANGAGLAMSTVDAITDRGLLPANFLDIGGAATPQKILDCFRQIADFPNIEIIVVNIFGGIVRCDEVAQAIISAKEQIANLPHLAIRLTGNNENEARNLLQKHNLPLYNSLEEVLENLS